MEAPYRTLQYCWTNGWDCLWRGHSVYWNRPLIPHTTRGGCEGVSGTPCGGKHTFFRHGCPPPPPTKLENETLKDKFFGPILAHKLLVPRPSPPPPPTTSLLPTVHQLEAPCATTLSEGPTGKVCGNFTAPVADWVSGGLRGSKFSAGRGASYDTGH